MISSYDIQLLYFFQHDRFAALDRFFIPFSFASTFASISLILGLFFLSLYRKSKEIRTKSYLLLSTFLVASLTSFLLKNLIHRQRPFVSYPFIQKLSEGGSSSFPSGHTLEAFTIAATVAAIGKSRKLSFIVYCWAILVAYSRMILGVHYPSDILGGIVAGTLIGMIVPGFTNKYLKRLRINNATKQAAKLKRFSLLILLLTSLSASSQNTKNFYYLIKKQSVDNGKLRIIYRDTNGVIQPVKMCYPKLKAEGLSMENGVPVFHFERIPSSEFDTLSNCISNNTSPGQFEIDVKKKKVGDPKVVVKLPFHAWNWNISLIPYRIRFPQNGDPVYAEASADALAVSVMYGYTLGYAKITHESINHYYLTIGPFAGLTSADLNGNTVTNVSLLAKDQSNLAISYGLSTMLGRNNFGFSFSFGFDASMGKSSYLWIYQNKPWVGVGVSTNLGLLQ